MKVDISKYSEIEPHRFKRIVWKVLNATLFPILGNQNRRRLLNLFGAKIKPGLIYRSVRVHAPWNLVIDDWTCIGPRVEIYNKDLVTIGKKVVISQDSYLCTASHDVNSPVMALVTKPITICDNSWIAAKVALMPGVSIGEGAVVGACAVVTKDVAPWTVVGGNPARFIKNREIRGA